MIDNNRCHALTGKDIVSTLEKCVARLDRTWLLQWLETFEAESVSQNSTRAYCALVNDYSKSTPGKQCYACFHGDLILSILLTRMDMEDIEAIDVMRWLQDADGYGIDHMMQLNYTWMQSMGIPMQFSYMDLPAWIQEQINEELTCSYYNSDFDSITLYTWEDWHSVIGLSRVLLVDMIGNFLTNEES